MGFIECSLISGLYYKLDICYKFIAEYKQKLFKSFLKIVGQRQNTKLFCYYDIYSLELRRRIRQDSDSDRQQSLHSRSEVVDGSASFLSKSTHSIHTQQSSQSSYYEERNNYNYGKIFLNVDHSYFIELNNQQELYSLHAKNVCYLL